MAAVGVRYFEDADHLVVVLVFGEDKRGGRSGLDRERALGDAAAPGRRSSWRLVDVGLGEQPAAVELEAGDLEVIGRAADEAAVYVAAVEGEGAADLADRQSRSSIVGTSGTSMSKSSRFRP